MAKTRFYKRTKGFNAEVIVGNTAAYTTDSTYADFVANAVNGEIGVYNATTNALIAANANMAEGTRVFIAQKRGSEIHKTTPFVFTKNTVTKTAYIAPVKQVTTISLANYTPVAGDEVAIKVIETTPGHEQFPSITYNYTVKTGDTGATIATAFRALINNANSPENRDGRKFVTASGATTNVVLTADYFGSSFRVATPGALYGAIATPTLTTPFKSGSGAADQVAAIEIEGLIYEGVTTQYPGDGLSPLDFGTPNTFAADGATYDIYNFTPVKNEKSPTPVNQHHHYWNAIVAIPSSGGPSVAISTIFGFTTP